MKSRTIPQPRKNNARIAAVNRRRRAALEASFALISMASGLARATPVTFPASFSTALTAAQASCSAALPGIAYCSCAYNSMNAAINSYLTASGGDSNYDSAVSANHSAYNMCSSAAGFASSDVWW